MLTPEHRAEIASEMHPEQEWRGSEIHAEEAGHATHIVARKGRATTSLLSAHNFHYHRR
jgi:hypothetical protein